MGDGKRGSCWAKDEEQGHQGYASDDNNGNDNQSDDEQEARATTAIDMPLFLLREVVEAGTKFAMQVGEASGVCGGDQSNTDTRREYQRWKREE